MLLGDNWRGICASGAGYFVCCWRSEAVWGHQLKKKIRIPLPVLPVSLYPDLLPPDDEKTIPGTEFYIWSTSSLEGSKYEVLATKDDTGYANPTLIITSPPSQNQCTIKVAVDDNAK
jgi:hypothetical protein